MRDNHPRMRVIVCPIQCILIFAIVVIYASLPIQAHLSLFHRPQIQIEIANARFELFGDGHVLIRQKVTLVMVRVRVMRAQVGILVITLTAIRAELRVRRHRKVHQNTYREER